MTIEPYVLVIAGPPCSLKSTLAKRISKERNIEYRSMDELRLEMFPRSDNRMEHRNLAYRRMHAEAMDLVGRRRDSVVLDATYQPLQRRADLETLARNLNPPVSIYLVECQVMPAIARMRFEHWRDHGAHAAVDLTPEKVEALAGQYPYSNLGLTLNTDDWSDEGFADLAATINTYIDLGQPICHGNWDHSQAVGTSGPHKPKEGENPLLLTENSRGRQVWRRRGLQLVTVLSVSLLALAIRAAVYAFATERSSTKRIEWVEPLIALGLVAATFIAWWEYKERSKREAETITKAGDIPRYYSTEAAAFCRPPDLMLYQLYYPKARDKRRFCIPRAPVYFVVPPRKPFRVIVKEYGEPPNDESLSRSAARLGFDWHRFKKWRLDVKKRDYVSFVLERGIRCTGLDAAADDVVMWGVPVDWAEYVCRELSLDRRETSILPDMRALFEGPGWNGRDGLDLLDILGKPRGIATGDKPRDRYSMLVNTTTLVTTIDGFVVLHRRSKHVSEGKGGLSATSSGFTHWDRDTRQADLERALESAALRELKEEMNLVWHGWQQDLVSIDRPFMAAGYNLLHGRDLAFYAHFESVHDHKWISEHRLDAHDRWEIANLVFVPVECINDDGTFSHPIAHLQRECNRHLRAALYSFAKSGELARIRARPQTRERLLSSTSL